MSMNLFTPDTSEGLKQLFQEIFYSKQSVVNKISDGSIANGLGYGVAKVGQKSQKDIAQALSKLFPDSSYGTQLDACNQIYGIAPRFGASPSVTYIRCFGAPGTTYTAGVNTFQSSTGIQFDIEQTTIIGPAGFTYVPVRSTTSGANTNSPGGSIVKIAPVPSGHLNCVNEYGAMWGRDVESDTDFRQRIINGPNILAKGTLAAIEQAFMLINNNVLGVQYQGINNKGQLQLAILTVNGMRLNKNEINQLMEASMQFFGLSEYRPFGRKSYGVHIINLAVQPIDISFRCQLQDKADPDVVRTSMQTRIAKYLDPRSFRAGIDFVDWAQLLFICRNTPGMRYIPDNEFFPAVNIPTNPNAYCRVRGFQMLNLDGSVLNDLSGAFSPIYYSNNADFQYWASVLRTIPA